MNPAAAAVDPTAPPQPPRSSFSCDRHPVEQFSGFCPSCLCERLVTLDKSSSNTPSSSRRPSSASATAAAIKALFSSSSSKPVVKPAPPKPVKNSFFPELRRTKSFSVSKNEASRHFFEPQRKSCDVRLRNSNTLSTLFALDDENKIQTINSKKPSSSSTQNHAQFSLNPVHNDISIPKKSVFKETQNEDCFKQPENAEAPPPPAAASDDDGDEITPVLDSHLENLRENVNKMVTSDKTIEGDVSMNLIKDHTVLDSGEKKSSGGRFWAAASVFRKKWHNWRRVHKIKKPNNVQNTTTLPVVKPISMQYMETQSEVADYGFGRRSCDTDPRFSLDVARISFDGPRYSFDEPRASWDGHLIGRTFPRMATTPMLIPVEEPARNCTNEQAAVLPGGSAQTREYYSDSSSRRRRSLDRCNSSRKAETVEEEKDMIELDSQTLRGDFSETFELSSGILDSNSTMRNVEPKESTKKPRSWSWKIWDFIHRFGNGAGKLVEDEYENEKERSYVGSFSESWQALDRVNRSKVVRSNSGVSWRNSGHFRGSFGKSNVEVNRNESKSSGEFVFEKSRSVRFCKNEVGNECVRFYVTPVGRGQRGVMKSNSISSSQSMARSVLRLY